MTRLALSLAAFLVAVRTFSGLWEAFRSAWQGQPTVPPLSFLGFFALFVLSLGYLAFVIYAADRAAGRVRHRIGLFERLLERRGAPDARSRP